MSLTLYGSGLSPFVRKVRIVLAEKNVPYTLEPINPFRPPADFEKISPLKRIPILRDSEWADGETLPDSSVIVDYLENRYPKPKLIPTEPFQRARALWFEEYIDGGLQPVGVKLFFERVVKKFLHQPTDEAICERAKQELPAFFDYLNRELAAKIWFVGDSFSIADIAVGSLMVNYFHCEEALDAVRWPNLTAFVRRVHTRPSVAELIDEELPVILKARSMEVAPKQQ